MIDTVIQNSSFLILLPDSQSLYYFFPFLYYLVMSDYEEIDYNKPLSFGIWKKMLPFILPQKKMLVRCTLLMLSVALVDVLLPLILGYAIRHNIQPRSAQGIGKLLVAAFLLMSAQGINVRFFVGMGLKVEMGINRALKDAVFFHLQKLGIGS